MATLKQKEAVKEIVENRGGVSSAMLKVGYKPKTAKNPKNLTESKGWQELMEQYLPDKDLARVHREGLDLKPEHPTRHKYLDTAYKLKKKYPAEEHNINLGRKSTDKLDEEEVNRLMEVFKK